MALIPDQDRIFQGQVDASTPPEFLGEGVIRRLINGRFIEGAITNGVGFDELEFTYIPRRDRKGNQKLLLPASRVKFEELLLLGDVQLAAPIENMAGKAIIMVISGRIFRLDVEEMIARDITPLDASLPEKSSEYALSFTDNSGGTYGVGGYLVIFNYPNKSILINDREARVADPTKYEVPPARLGATAGGRLFIVSGDNLLYASDPLGGANPLAPLTFEETLNPDLSFYKQRFEIGSVLNTEYVTAIARLPRYLSANQDFLAQALLISTVKRKYTAAAASPRDSWDSVQFISYAGTVEGIAGPHASTNIGDVLINTTTSGRIKNIGQDQQRETSLSETYLDENLGQYLCPCEEGFHFREWYSRLDHSRSILKYVDDRFYATVYPFEAPALLSDGSYTTSPTHRALAIATIDPKAAIGPNASLSWESFYDWLNPIGVIDLGGDIYVVSKDEFGRIKYYRENSSLIDNHPTIIYTRGYFVDSPGLSRSIIEGHLYFKKLHGKITVSVDYLIDGVWQEGSKCTVSDKMHKFSFKSKKCKTDGPSIPLRITLDHKGCRFELSTIRVSGEAHRQEK